MSRVTAWRLLSAVLVLAFVVGCADQRGGILPRAQPTPPAVSLEGPLWKLQSYVTSGGRSVKVLSGTIVTANFASGVMSGSAGCNQYSTGYRASDDRIWYRDTTGAWRFGRTSFGKGVVRGRLLERAPSRC